ncbi:MAG: hypothetical protein R3251_00770 [Candidatus Spechtbacterales bacterium]|nr:hypothetical protein [Candidatus Spechtbacterales bacterium]
MKAFTKEKEEAPQEQLPESVRKYAKLIERELATLPAMKDTKFDTPERHHRRFVESVLRGIVHGNKPKRLNGFWVTVAEIGEKVIEVECPGCHRSHPLLKFSSEHVSGDGRFVDYSYTTSNSGIYCPITTDTCYI